MEVIKMASVQMEELKNVMKGMMERGLMPSFGSDIDPVRLRQVIEQAQANMPLLPNVTFLSEKFGEMDAELSMPEDNREDAILVYIHGGGLICGNAVTSRGYASMLANETKIPTYAFSYRLAPEHPYPAAVEDCFLAYKKILENNPDKPIFLIGESGGAYLCITTALKARDNGVKMPAAIVPYSPLIDLSNAFERMRENNKDFTVKQEFLPSLQQLYAPDPKVRKEIYVSPYYDDFHDMCPIFLAWDTTETLAIDSEIIMEKAKTMGIEVAGKGYDDCFHAFATAGRGTPESSEVLDNTIAFIEARIV